MAVVTLLLGIVSRNYEGDFTWQPTMTTAALMAAAALLQPVTGHAVQLNTEESASVHAWIASA